MNTEKSRVGILRQETGYPDLGVSPIKVPFLTMHTDGSYSPGATVETLIDLSLERLRELNSEFSSRENAIAITKLQEARMWLDERTRDRVERGVEGKHQE